MLISCMEILRRHDKNLCLSTSICTWTSRLWTLNPAMGNYRTNPNVWVFFVATERFSSPRLFKRTDSWICFCTRDSQILIKNSNIHTLPGGGGVKISPFQGSSEDEFPFPLVGYVSVPWRVGSLWVCLTYKPPQRKKTSFPTLRKFNSSPLKSHLPNRKGSSSNHHFSGAMLNFGGVFFFETFPNRWGNNSNSSSVPWRWRRWYELRKGGTGDEDVWILFNSFLWTAGNVLTVKNNHPMICWQKRHPLLYIYLVPWIFAGYLAYIV